MAKHDWRPLTRTQVPPRVKCSRCGAVRRWSFVAQQYAYYSGVTGAFVPRPPPCVAR